MLDDDSSLNERPSKSQRKRDMLALQELGRALVELPAAQLAKIPLEPRLADAIEAARSFKSHEAKRRQLQYIGRIMRDINPEPIEAALTKIQSQNQLHRAALHQVERWRDQLIAEGDKQVQEFMQQFPQTDSQQLRQLVRNAQQAKPGAETVLFRFLRTLIETDFS